MESLPRSFGGFSRRQPRDAGMPSYRATRGAVLRGAALRVPFVRAPVKHPRHTLAGRGQAMVFVQPPAAAAKMIAPFPMFQNSTCQPTTCQPSTFLPSMSLSFRRLSSTWRSGVLLPRLYPRCRWPPLDGPPGICLSPPHDPDRPARPAPAAPRAARSGVMRKCGRVV